MNDFSECDYFLAVPYLKNFLKNKKEVLKSTDKAVRKRDK